MELSLRVIKGLCYKIYFLFYKIRSDMKKENYGISIRFNDIELQTIQTNITEWQVIFYVKIKTEKS